MTTVKIPAPFAQSGTLTPIDLTRTDGVVNFTQGYTDDYSRELGVDTAAKAVERDKLNYLLNLITVNILDWETSCVPQWLTATAYAVNAFTRYTGTAGQVERVYRCLAASAAGILPTNTTYWEEVISVTALKALIPMIDSGLITASIDFNNVAKGWWSISDPSVATACPNSPSSQAGVLACYSWATAANVSQVYYATDGTTYSRGNGGAGWSAWKSNVGLAGTLPVSGGGTGIVNIPAGNFISGNGTAAVSVRTPAQVRSDIGAATAAQGAKADTALQAADITGKYDKTGGVVSGTVLSQGFMANAFAGLNPGAAQGAYLGWNQDGTGKTEFWNNQGTGSGGWRFVNMTSSTAATVAVSIDGVGNISAASLSVNGTVSSNVISANTVTAAGNVNGQNVNAAGNVTANTISASGNITTTGTVAAKTLSVSVGSLGTGQYSQNYAATYTGTDSNGDSLLTGLYRGNAGSSWTTAGWRLQRRVDATLMEYIQFGSADGSGVSQLIFGAGSQAINFSNNGMTVSTSLTVAGGFQFSDKRLKKEIKLADVHRGIALKMAKAFRSWRMKDSGAFDKGLIAQWVQKHVGHYVNVGSDKRKLLGIDKSGLALEGVMDNALSIKELSVRIAKLEKQLARLEKRK